MVAIACIAPWERPSLHVAALGAPAAFAPAPALSVGRCAARPGTCLQTRATRRRTANRLAGALRAKGEDDPADQSGEKEDGEEMSKFNAEIYSELRDHFAVSAEQPTIASKRGGSEVFTYMPPSFRDREATQRLLPSPEFTPQEVISTILQAMKANRKFGCSIYLRFMSDKHEYSRLTGEDLQVLCFLHAIAAFFCDPLAVSHMSSCACAPASTRDGRANPSASGKFQVRVCEASCWPPPARVCVHAR